jgi:anti-sigma factor RsiW
MDRCFDEGMIQAFLDGELASDLSEKVACHVAMCDGCANILAVAEEESSFAFAALDAELNMLVPTERIRTRLFETIATERETFWQKIFGKGFRWTNPSVAAFASLILVIGLFATLWIVRENSASAPQVAVNVRPSQSTVAQNPPTKTEGSTPAIVNPPVVPLEEDDAVAPQTRQAAYKPKNERFVAQPAIYKPDTNSGRTGSTVTPLAPPSEAISGEESYIKTIATLQQAVENRKDELMKPSSRVAFEKDMAVVNDAIKKMRHEVRKNPKNEAAKEVLRSSYQNKIDLLNSVAEKSELMATLNRK